MRDFDGPEEFLESLRDADIVRKRQSLLYVQALKFIQTKATPEAARKRTLEARGGRGRGPARSDAGKRTAGRPVQSLRSRCPRPTTRSERSTSSARSAS